MSAPLFGRCLSGPRCRPTGRASLRCLVGFAASIAIAGCDDSYFESGPLYREAFKECLAAIPEGPQRTNYNDWDEVVSGCQSYAAQVTDRTPAQGTSGSAQDRNGLDPQGAGPVANGDAPTPSEPNHE